MAAIEAPYEWAVGEFGVAVFVLASLVAAFSNMWIAGHHFMGYPEIS